MHIYQPYEPIVETKDTLHLKLSDARERMLFVTHRAVPIALILLAWYVLQQGAETPMGFKYTIVILCLAVVAMFFFKSYIAEIKIAEGNIFMVQKTLLGVKQINVPVSNVEYISVMRRQARQGAKFILHTKQKRHFVILHIPPAWVSDKNLSLIAETLRGLLSVEVKMP